MKRKNNEGITLISLVVTIIVLIILASISISLIFTQNNGLIGNAKDAVNKTKEQMATEKINLKITNSQINSYAISQRMPTLQELANDFCEDNEIQYVTLESKKVASLEKIDIGEATSIFTKLKEYPYEFEINSSLQLASIDGVKIANNTSSGKKVLWSSNGEKGTTEVELEEKISNYDLLIVNFRIQTTPRTITIDTSETGKYGVWYSAGSMYLSNYIEVDLENNKVSYIEGGNATSWKGKDRNYIDKIIGIKL